MFMIRMCTNLNLPRIGRACGGKYHSTIKYVFAQIDRKLNNDPALSRLVQQV
ncbi:hypothetical protein KBY72_09730 [Cyanobium sp. BA5m-21]|nr:hypothetical protein [Cyanobium sp. BA5m-10]MCP9907449.1 hypothetical protein [Cyanobium sp. BA5m-21]